MLAVMVETDLLSSHGDNQLLKLVFVELPSIPVLPVLFLIQLIVQHKRIGYVSVQIQILPSVVSLLQQMPV